MECYVQAPSIIKYGYRIRTRGGLVVDNIMIHGRDESDAQRKLRQMYHGCEILDCVCQAGPGRGVTSSYEDILGLIAR
jgi:hypothetical protein